MAAALLTLGAALIIGGLCLIDYRWAVVAFGVLVVAAGVDEVM